MVPLLQYYQTLTLAKNCSLHSIQQTVVHVRLLITPDSSTHTLLTELHASIKYFQLVRECSHQSYTKTYAHKYSVVISNSYNKTVNPGHKYIYSIDLDANKVIKGVCGPCNVLDTAFNCAVFRQQVLPAPCLFPICRRRSESKQRRRSRHLLCKLRPN